MSQSLDDTTAVWQLERYGRDGQQRSVPEGITVTVQFDDGRISGSGACNRYFGTYRESDGRFEVGPLATTQMMCGDEVMEVEAEYLSLLAVVTGLRIEGDRLLLEIDGEPVLEFGRLEQSLVGEWELIAYNNGKNAVVTVVLGSRVTAWFDEDGGLSGSAGCNRYRTDYRVENGSMWIDAPASTRRMCAEPDGVMEQERRYLEVLTEVVSWSFRDDGMLEMFDAAGARLLQFSRV
jgi:heat shock protein HslJ